MTFSAQVLPGFPGLPAPPANVVFGRTPLSLPPSILLDLELLCIALQVCGPLEHPCSTVSFLP